MQSGLQSAIVAIKAKGLIKVGRIEGTFLTTFIFEFAYLKSEPALLTTFVIQ
jgi:hypothetical protein